MPRECRNFNNVGKVSGLLLLLLAFLAVNPIANPSAFAEGVEDDYSTTNPDNYPTTTSDNYYETNFSGSNSSEDTDDFASLADTPSTVNISFSPASAATSLSPTTSTGQSAQLNVLATVSVQNSGGYSVYLKGNSINLVGQSNSNNYIPGATTAKTYTNMDTNTWGYYAKEGTAVPDTATYKAISVSGNGEKIVENTNKKIFTDTKNIMLSFAAKINDEKPADTYKNTITMSVISSPLQVTFAESGIITMQAMTSSICSNAPVGDAIQLKDTRDNKFYWIGKLADNKCWMTQNLDLDLSSAPGETSTGTIKTFTNADTDLNGIASWTPTSGTYSVATSSNVLNDPTGQRSWSLGNYRITNPTASNSCGTGKADIAACATASTTNDRFTPYTTPTTANGDANAHYIVGNHYQWNAATAGTGGSITSGQAGSSICPKGWRLPTSGKDANNSNIGEFQALITAGVINTVAKLASSPYYFVRGGDVWRGNYLLEGAGSSGNYWSSTPDSSTSNAYRLGFHSDGGYIFPSNNAVSDARHSGSSVRCIAR